MSKKFKKTPEYGTAREICEYLERSGRPTVVDHFLYLKAKDQGWQPMRDADGKQIIGNGRDGEE